MLDGSAYPPDRYVVLRNSFSSLCWHSVLSATAVPSRFMTYFIVDNSKKIQTISRYFSRIPLDCYNKYSLKYMYVCMYVSQHSGHKTILYPSATAY